MHEVVFASTIVIFVFSFILSILISMSYARSRSPSMLLWSLGIWFFALCVLLETVFALGIYSQFLIKLYLLLVAVLVEVLALGSVAFLHRKLFSYIYAAYSLAATLFLFYALIAAGSLGDLITNGVVYGSLPMYITLGSVLITAVGAIVLILISLISFLKRRDPRMLSIILGVLVLSAGGTLYIASFPAFLYLTEFVGILFIWLGFVDLRNIFQKRVTINKKAFQ